MTLIIAKKSGDALILLADTKLTPENNGPWTITSQANKIVSLSDGWALAYSGNTYVADSLLKNISDNNPYSFERLRAELNAINRQSIVDGDETEYLLINTISLSIYKFSAGQCSRIQGSTAWLGSKVAFEKYQELNHLPSSASHPLLSKPQNSGSDGFDIAPQVIDEKRKDVERRADRIFKAIIEDSATPEVGGFPLSLVVHQGKAKFWPRAGRLFTVPPGGLPPLHLRDPVFGNAAYGDFQYDVMAAWDATKNLIAVYFRSINKALVFRRWDDGIPYAKLIDDVSSSDPTKDLQERFGTPIWSVRITAVSLNEIHVNAGPPNAA